MKISAKLLLSSAFVFLPAVVFAQDNLGLQKDCGFAPALKGYTVEGRVPGAWPPLEVVSPQIVEDLEDGQNCLNDNLIQLKASVKDLQSAETGNAHLVTNVLDLEDKLEQSVRDLHTAETKIETLEDRLRTAEDKIEDLESRPWIQPHPASTKPAASKPNAPASKPKAPASHPKAQVNKPTPTTTTTH